MAVCKAQSSRQWKRGASLMSCCLAAAGRHARWRWVLCVVFVVRVYEYVHVHVRVHMHVHVHVHVRAQVQIALCRAACRGVCCFAGGSIDAGGRFCLRQFSAAPVLDATARATLMAFIDHHPACRVPAADGDVKVEINLGELEALVGRPQKQSLVEIFESSPPQSPVSVIMLRRVCATGDGLQIGFHTDVSLKTMQVARLSRSLSGVGLFPE
jgi:hypothetical protein